MFCLPFHQVSTLLHSYEAEIQLWSVKTPPHTHSHTHTCLWCHLHPSSLPHPALAPCQQSGGGCSTRGQGRSAGQKRTQRCTNEGPPASEGGPSGYADCRSNWPDEMQRGRGEVRLPRSGEASRRVRERLKSLSSSS